MKLKIGEVYLADNNTNIKCGDCLSSGHEWRLIHLTNWLGVPSVSLTHHNCPNYFGYVAVIPEIVARRFFKELRAQKRLPKSFKKPE